VRILYDIHLMEIGGSQLNAIELADAMRDAGHEVILFGPPGELEQVVESLGLEFIRSSVESDWPSARRMRTLTALVRTRQVDIAHGFEWGPALDLAFGPNRAAGLPIVVTILSMSVAHFLPRHVPLIVGTNELACGNFGDQDVHVIEPWIKEESNAPGAVGGRDRRREFGVDDDTVLVAVVCRLTRNLEKLDGVLVAIEVVAAMNDERPTDAPNMALVVAGGGEGLEEVEALAARVNQARVVPAVEVVGPMTDPRVAYDAADVVIGMGSSALKGMAFGKPLVVQGTGGYWETFTRSSGHQFLSRGFIGHGENSTGASGANALRDALTSLRDDVQLRDDLGRYGREVIERGFSLGQAVERHLHIYSAALEIRPTPAQRRRALGRSAVLFAVWWLRAKGSMTLVRVTRAGKRFGVPQWRADVGPTG
jgi:glycosyltransferase involved in cell wall biosynthesis